MKIAIIGSRDYTNIELIKKVVHSIHKKYPDAIIVSGGCRGPDRIAEQEAIKIGMKKPIIFEAEWEPNGVFDKGAGIKRNGLIVDESDIIVAFYNNTNGTRDTIIKAIKKGKKVFIYSDKAIKPMEL